MTVLVTGGSGCGKSHYAEALMRRLAPGEKIYIATMPCADQECAARIARHRAKRAGDGYVTLETGTLRHLPIPPGASVLLECLPTLLARAYFEGGDPGEIVPGLLALQKTCRHLVVVTNDVFSEGLSAYAPQTLAYLRLLAQINRQAATLSDAVVEVVYSIPVAVKGELP